MCCRDAFKFTFSHVTFYLFSLQWGVPSIHIISVVASRSGLADLIARHPDIHVTVGVIDDTLTEDGVVLPGLGDAGDRLYGTPMMDDDDSLVHPSKRRRAESLGE